MWGFLFGGYSPAAMEALGRAEGQMRTGSCWPHWCLPWYPLLPLVQVTEGLGMLLSLVPVPSIHDMPRSSRRRWGQEVPLPAPESSGSRVLAGSSRSWWGRGCRGVCRATAWAAAPCPAAPAACAALSRRSAAPCRGEGALRAGAAGTCPAPPPRTGTLLGGCRSPGARFAHVRPRMGVHPARAAKPGRRRVFGIFQRRIPLSGGGDGHGSPGRPVRVWESGPRGEGLGRRWPRWPCGLGRLRCADFGGVRAPPVQGLSAPMIPMPGVCRAGSVFTEVLSREGRARLSRPRSRTPERTGLRCGLPRSQPSPTSPECVCSRHRAPPELFPCLQPAARSAPEQPACRSQRCRQRGEVARKARNLMGEKVKLRGTKLRYR